MATQSIQISRTIALRKKLVKIHETRRLKKAVSYLKEDIAKHTKTDYDSIKLSPELNSYLLQDVAKHMSKVSVVITKDANVTKVDLSPELKKTKQKPVKTQSKETKKPNSEQKPKMQEHNKIEDSKNGTVKKETQSKSNKPEDTKSKN